MEEQVGHVHDTFGVVEWDTILFFVGLFIVVSDMEHIGLPGVLANWIIDMTGGTAPMFYG